MDFINFNDSTNASPSEFFIPARTTNIRGNEIENLTITRTVTVGTLSTDRQRITGSVFISGSERVQGSVNVVDGGQFQVDGVNVLDTALAFAIALG